jgi:hypothetical protein
MSPMDIFEPFRVVEPLRQDGKVSPTVDIRAVVLRSQPEDLERRVVFQPQGGPLVPQSGACCAVR